jgi:hypothetical protein
MYGRQMGKGSWRKQNGYNTSLNKYEFFIAITVFIFRVSAGLPLTVLQIHHLSG